MRSSSADSVQRMRPRLGRGFTHSETALVSRRKFIARSSQINLAWQCLPPRYFQSPNLVAAILRRTLPGCPRAWSSAATLGPHHNGGSAALSGDSLWTFRHRTLDDFAELCFGFGHGPIRCARIGYSFRKVIMVIIIIREGSSKSPRV